MGTQLHAVTIDCRDTVVMARFWSGVLGGVVRDAGNGYVGVEQVPGLAGFADASAANQWRFKRST